MVAAKALWSFGYATDVHYADKEPAIGRNYRDSLQKMAEATATWNRNDLRFVILGGDLIDGPNKNNLDAIKVVYDQVSHPRYYMFGNHCLEGFSKQEFMAATGMPNPYYYLDIGNEHRIVILDACYSQDDECTHYNTGNFSYKNTWIPGTERTWLANTALATSRKCIVFCHQRLDGDDWGAHDVGNTSVIRAILEAAGNVMAVIIGHSHINHFAVVNNIAYYTMPAMVTGAYPANAYAIVHVMEDETLTVEGFGEQKSYG